MQLSSGFGIDGCSPDPTEPMESCAVDLRGPGFGIGYMNIDLLASTFLRFVRLSPGHPVVCDDISLWKDKFLNYDVTLLFLSVVSQENILVCDDCNNLVIKVVCNYLRFSFGQKTDTSATNKRIFDCSRDLKYQATNLRMLFQLYLYLHMLLSILSLSHFNLVCVK